MNHDDNATEQGYQHQHKICKKNININMKYVKKIININVHGKKKKEKALKRRSEEKDDIYEKGSRLKSIDGQHC